MRKLLLTGVVGSALVATGAIAEDEVNYTYIDIDYVVSSVDVGQFECWSECPGDQEPDGLRVVGSVDVGNSLFVRGSYTSLEEEEKHYEEDITSEFDEWSLGVGWVFNNSNNSSTYLAVDYLQTEFTYEWDDPNPGSYDYKYDDIEADTVAVTLGNRSQITQNLGFEAALGVGGNDYRRIELALVNRISDNLSIKAAFTNTQYSLEEGEYVYGPDLQYSQDDWNDGDDVDLDVETLSLGLRYNF